MPTTDWTKISEAIAALEALVKAQPQPAQPAIILARLEEAEQILKECVAAWEDGRLTRPLIDRARAFLGHVRIGRRGR